MTPTATLRPAGPDDRAAIAALQITSWRSAYRGILGDAFLDGPIEAERGGLWQARLTPPLDPDQVVILAEADGHPVGFSCILCGHDPAWGSLVDNLHVHPDWKRTRIGRALLREAALQVPDRHAATPIYLTVFEANRAAIAAYERWGGRLAERLDHREPDGGLHPLRRYAWDSPAALVERLDRAVLGTPATRP